MLDNALPGGIVRSFDLHVAVPRPLLPWHPSSINKHFVSLESGMLIVVKLNAGCLPNLLHVAILLSSSACYQACLGATLLAQWITNAKHRSGLDIMMCVMLTVQVTTNTSLQIQEQ